MLKTCLEEDVCLYRPNARWGGEFDWLKTPQGPSPHDIREGFKENSPYSSENKLQHIQLSDTTGAANGTGFYGQMNWK